MILPVLLLAGSYRKSTFSARFLPLDRSEASLNKKTVQLRRSVPEPAHRFARFYHFTLCCPTLDCASLHRRDHRCLKNCPVLSKPTALLCLLSSMSSLQSP